ncbi:MAG: hypothetical protein ACKOQ8_06170 [Micrococcales bacterium]
MSAIRLTEPNRRNTVALTAITGGMLGKLVGRDARKSRAGIAVLVLVGLGAIQILQLVLNSFVAAGAYQLVDLKNQKRELTVTQQILGEQVDSLSSNQNLANAAQKMGMISNANPVFLRLADKKVFGKPKAALNADNRISRNLIKSAVLTVTSDLTAANATAADATAANIAPTQQITLSPVAGSIANQAQASVTANKAVATAPVASKPTVGAITLSGTAPKTTVPGSTGSQIPAQPTR